MKVNGSSDGIRMDPAGGKAAAKTGPGAKTASADTASVRLSGASAALSAGESEAEFDTAKVDNIKQAIREGRFGVDSGVVADRMIASVSDLFGPVH